MVKLRLVTDDDISGLAAEPHPSECVACFLDRMTRAHGCSNRLTWAALWRDRQAPRATALEQRLESQGGFCDCEVLMNVYARPEWLDDDPDAEAGLDAEPPECFGVRKGSSQPCLRWIAGPL
jgi:hypothetical protein